jgi:uncharacterized membrane protein
MSQTEKSQAKGLQAEKVNVAVGTTKLLSLDYKTAAMLAYLPLCAVNLVFSIIWIRTEESRFLRFHALQSLVLTGVFMAVGAAVWGLTVFLLAVPFLGFLSALVQLVWLAATVVYIWKSISGMIDAYNGRMSRIEYVGQIAEQLL